MKSNSEDKINHFTHNTCPYLGLSGDPETFSAVPSDWNVCHHVTPISTPKFNQQKNFCLQTEYTTCPIYNSPSGQKMLKSIQSQKRGLSKSEKKRIRRIVISVIALLLLSGIMISSLLGVDLIRFFSQDMNTPQSNHKELSQNTSQSPQPTASDELSIETITKTSTEPPRTPIAQLTSTPTDVDPILALDTPIGDENQFIIHRVEEGESLQIFADFYNTSVEAIRNVNYDLIAPLWIDWLLVIPVNTTDVSGIPTFEPYQVEVERIPIEQLSEQLSIPLSDIILYNNLDAEHVLKQGEWLLIPRERSSP